MGKHKDIEKLIYQINDISLECVNKIESFLSDNNAISDCSLTTGLSGVLSLITPYENKNNITRLGQYILTNCNKNDISLFSGLSGIGVSMLTINQHYDLSDIILKIVSIIMEQDNLFNNNLSELQCIDYDLSYGVTGITSFILSVLNNIEKENIDNHIYEQMILYINKYLNYIDNILNNPVENHYPFWISQENQMIIQDKKMFSNGSYNIGIAHGILGVIQVLTRINSMNLFQERTKKIILKLTNLILMFLTERDNGIIIPPRATDNKKILDNTKFLYQDGWCYGQLSIGLTLLRVGNLFSIEKYKKIGNKIVKQSLNRISEIDSFLPSSIVCHGKSSVILLLCYASKYHLLDESTIKNYIFFISNKIISQYDDKNKFGFQDQEYDIQNNQYVYFDKFNFLEGTTGIVLTLQLVKQYLLGNDYHNIILDTLVN